MAKSRRPRVLLADDETHCRTLMKAVLGSMNCDIVGEAKTGIEAIDLYGRLKPDSMFLDVNMPIKTGDEVLEAILGNFPDAFIIMLTSMADMETVENCISLGASNFLRKDTPVPELKKIVRETWKALKAERGY